MRHLIEAGGAFDKACRWIEGLYRNNWLVQYVIAPALLALPPWAVNQLLENNAAKTWLSKNFPDVAQFLNTYNVLFFAAAAVYSYVLLAIAGAIVKRAASTDVDRHDLLALLQAIDGVVGAKLGRFSKHARGNSLTAENAFATITDPVVQIAEITRCIAEYFNAALPPKQKRLIRVVLAEITNDRISDIVCFFPQDAPIQSSIKDLNKPNSAIMTAVRTRRVVVIDDIAKELRRSNPSYVATGNQEDHVGSIICYPVVTGPKQVSFVISIHCEEDKWFRRARAGVYGLALDRFALRMKLEYELLQLKEKLCGDQK